MMIPIKTDNRLSELMPKEMKIPIEIYKFKNIVTVHKEIMKAICTTTFIPKKGVTLIKTKKAKQMMAPIDIHLCLTL